MNNTPPATKQTVKRYDPCYHVDLARTEMDETDDGKYVLFSDYEALEKERDAWRHYHKLASDTADKELAELAALKSEVQKLREDKARLDWLNSHGAYISHSNDGEVCNVWKFDEDGEQEPVEGFPQKCYYDFREAIDKARAALQPKAGEKGEK